MTPFLITANEIAVSKERAKNYDLFRLQSFPETPTIRILRPPLSDIAALTPVAFRAQII